MCAATGCSQACDEAAAAAAAESIDSGSRHWGPTNNGASRRSMNQDAAMVLGQSASIVSIVSTVRAVQAPGPAIFWARRRLCSRGGFNVRGSLLLLPLGGIQRPSTRAVDSLQHPALDCLFPTSCQRRAHSPSWLSPQPHARQPRVSPRLSLARGPHCRHYQTHTHTRAVAGPNAHNRHLPPISNRPSFHFRIVIDSG